MSVANISGRPPLTKTEFRSVGGPNLKNIMAKAMRKTGDVRGFVPLPPKPLSKDAVPSWLANAVKKAGGV